MLLAHSLHDEARAALSDTRRWRRVGGGGNALTLRTIVTGNIRPLVRTISRQLTSMNAIDDRMAAVLHRPSPRTGPCADNELLLLSVTNAQVEWTKSLYNLCRVCVCIFRVRQRDDVQSENTVPFRRSAKN